MDPTLSYHSYLEQLTTFATSEEPKSDLIAAKAEYFRLTGDVYEDDKSFEMRMASFLDYFLFDRIHPDTGKTPAVEYLERISKEGTGDEVAPFRMFTETLHSLFEVRKLSKGAVKLREPFSGVDYEVTERRQLAGLEKGDVLEARLIPFNGHLLFSSAFCYHPRPATKPILKEIKRRKKKEPERTPKEMAWECAKMALKVDRYRQVTVEKIYDFDSKR